jgi:fructose 5-dehydrogenase cytochrome subunit
VTMRMTSIHFGRFLALIAVVVIAAGAQAADQSNSDAALIKRGEYLATAADCAACHTVPHGLPFAGGLALVTPVGTIYSTNITPSRSSGIGSYTEQQFSRAVREGVRGDGSNLYPAMPYTSYARFTATDMQALYAYFAHGVEPVDVTARETALPFPMNIRASMKVWNALFLDSRSYSPDPGQSAEWNRGAYLVKGAAHCSVCHTERGFLMQENASRQLSGAQVGPWFAPNITSDATSGIGSWTRDELKAYLRTGRLVGKAQAAGSMGEAVEHSFQSLEEGDIEAIATYVKNVPAVHDSADAQSRFVAGKMFSALATLRGSDGIRSDEVTALNGAELFQGSCASCHSAAGEGSKDGYFPSLFHNSATGAHRSDNLIAAILYGVNRKTSDGQSFMPGFGGKSSDAMQLSNRDIVLLGNYVLAQYGRSDVVLTEQEVAVVRRGGPSSILVEVAQGCIEAGAVVVLLLLVFIVVRRRKAREG